MRKISFRVHVQYRNKEHSLRYYVNLLINSYLNNARCLHCIIIIFSLYGHSVYLYAHQVTEPTLAMCTLRSLSTMLLWECSSRSCKTQLMGRRPPCLLMGGEHTWDSAANARPPLTTPVMHVMMVRLQCYTCTIDCEYFVLKVFRFGNLLSFMADDVCHIRLYGKMNNSYFGSH